jgi:hypothetical protein
MPMVVSIALLHMVGFSVLAAIGLSLVPVGRSVDRRAAAGEQHPRAGTGPARRNWRGGRRGESGTRGMIAAN